MERSKVLIVDDEAGYRALLSEFLESRGYVVATAPDGEVGLARAGAPDIGAVLLDLVMPGMGGLDLLRALREKYPELPVVVFTSDAGGKAVAAAKVLGIRDYVLKTPLNPEELLARLEKYLAPPPVGPPASSAEAQRLSPLARRSDEPAAETGRDGAPSLRPVTEGGEHDSCRARIVAAAQRRAISGVIGRLLAVTASERTTVAQVVKVIEREPTLAARVVKAARSAAFAGEEPSETLDAAVTKLGFSRVSELAVALSLLDSYSDGVGAAEGWRRWRHCVAVAELSRSLGASTAPGSSYLAGLCHGLLEVVMEDLAPGAPVDFTAAGELGAVRNALKREHGVSVEFVVDEACRELGLPQAVARAIRLHVLGSPDGKGVSDRLSACRYLANGMMMGATPRAAIKPLTTEEVRRSLAHRGGADEVAVWPAIRCITEAARQGLGEGRGAGRPCGRVLYVRHCAFSDPDPVEWSLRHLAETTVASQMPTDAGELSEQGAIVVVKRRPGGAWFDARSLAILERAGVDPRSRLCYLCGEEDAAVRAEERWAFLRLYPYAVLDLRAFVETSSGSDARDTS